MALIKCPSCGEGISERAKICPKCGQQNLLQPEEELKLPRCICEECGTEYDAELVDCPNCGCPNPLTETNIGEKEADKKQGLRNKKKGLVIVGVTALLMLVIGGWLIYHFAVDAPKKNYENAVALLERGKYEDAEEILIKLGDYKDTKTILEEIKYESIAYACIGAWKQNLKNPDSFTPYEIEFYIGESAEDTSHPTCVMHYGAQNGFGGNTTGYVMGTYSAEKETYTIVGYCHSLDEDDLDEDDDDYIIEMLTQVMIKALKEKGTKVGTLDMARLKIVLKSDAYTSVKIIE